ncbi:MAG: class I SAM-dependent methyltransferase [Pirellulaceae bacterium]|nr:class I SAM-dependent methyltransferase [Pirellulaceae bacterium]
MAKETYSQILLKGGPLVRWQRFARFHAAVGYMQQLGAHQQQRLLDIGAADGIGLPFFEPLFKEVVCLNYYENHCRELLSAFPGRTVVAADARNIPLPDGGFSFVVSLETLHLIPERREDAIRQVHRLLEPGGHFIFSVPIEIGYTALLKYFSRGLSRHGLDGMNFPMALRHVFPKAFNVKQFDKGRQVGFDAYDFRDSIAPWFDVIRTRVLPLPVLLPFNLMVVARRK